METLPGSMNLPGSENAFAGYEIDFFFAGMMGGGMGNMECGEHMEFGSSANLQFHYTDTELQENNIDESTAQVKYWDTHSNSWIVISGATLDMANNTISFSTDAVGNFFILTGDSPTSIKNTNDLIVEDFALLQNYPNPFNPSTSIEFYIGKRSNVSLSIFNLLGQKIDDLVNEQMEPGTYNVSFDASGLASGVYLYQLRTDEITISRKMQLLK